MPQTPHPVAIEYVSAKSVLKITFSDDLVAEYPTVYLRGYCPCARCQGHGAGPPSWIPVTHAKQAEVEDVTPVGNYAICIAWADGHDTGIYTFASLREMHQPDGYDPKETVVAGK